MVLKPSDLEMIVKKQEATDAERVGKLFSEVSPIIDKQLESYSDLFREGKPIVVDIEFPSLSMLYAEKLTQKIMDEYSSGQDGWDVCVGGLTLKDNSPTYSAKFEFSQKPKTRE